MKVKQGKNVIWLILKIPLTIQWTALDKTFSLIWLLIGLSFKNNQITLCPSPPYLKQVLGQPKTGLGTT